MKRYIKKAIDKVFFHHLLILGISIIITIILIGTIIFQLIEGHSFFDSIYFIIMTITTIGYGDIVPLTHGGKILAMIYGFMGVPLFIGIMSLIFEKRIKKRIEKSITEIHNELNKTTEILEETQEKLEKDEKLIKQEKKKIQEESKKLEKVEKELKNTDKVLESIKKEKKKSFFSKLFGK